MHDCAAVGSVARLRVWASRGWRSEQSGQTSLPGLHLGAGPFGLGERTINGPEAMAWLDENRPEVATANPEPPKQHELVGLNYGLLGLGSRPVALCSRKG